MKARRLGLALFVVCAAVAATVSSAYAENEFEEGVSSAWYVGGGGGTKLAEGSTANLKAAVATGTGTLTLRTAHSGTSVKITATGINCVGCVIKNVGTSAEITGKLELTGMKLIEPLPQFCSVPATVITKPLVASARMKKGSSTIATLRFVPEIAAGWFSVEVKGANCIFQRNFEFKGALFAEPVKATGVFSTTQTWQFSSDIQKSAGSEFSFNTVTDPAFLEGSVSGLLESGMTFALEEK
jgi:hypothetical protein